MLSTCSWPASCLIKASSLGCYIAAARTHFCTAVAAQNHFKQQLFQQTSCGHEDTKKCCHDCSPKKHDVATLSSQGELGVLSNHRSSSGSGSPTGCAYDSGHVPLATGSRRSQALPQLPGCSGTITGSLEAHASICAPSAGCTGLFQPVNLAQNHRPSAATHVEARSFPGAHACAFSPASGVPSLPPADPVSSFLPKACDPVRFQSTSILNSVSSVLPTAYHHISYQITSFPNCSFPVPPAAYNSTRSQSSSVLNSIPSLPPPPCSPARCHSTRTNSWPTGHSSSGAVEGADGLAYLDSFKNYERAGVPVGAGTGASHHFDLSRMTRLLEHLGNPHRKWQAVHVAGTKGKGSTVALLSSVLRAAGYRVGSYTSPHVFSITERIATGPSPISASELDVLVRSHKGTLQRVQKEEGGALTHFEVLTALAFRHFADEGVEVAVVETGLGGLMDATNVFTPDGLAAAVITPIGLDHVEALGGSLKSIAEAKAGILKNGRPLILGPQPHAEAKQQVLQAAEKLHCPVVMAASFAEVISRGWEVSDPATHIITPTTQLAQEVVAVKVPEAGWSLEEVKMKLVGGHQHGNIGTVCAAVQCMRDQGWRVDESALSRGLSEAFLPGRMQVLPFHTGSGRTHYLVLDGAHTAESAHALASCLRTYLFPSQPVALVLSMAADKPHREVVTALRSLKPRVAIFTQVPIGGSYQRACPPGTLAAQWQSAAFLDRKLNFRCRELIQASMAAALDKARHELHAFGDSGIVCVTGSLHAVAQAYQQL